MTDRPRLTPPVADIRRAVRGSLAALRAGGPARGRVHAPARHAAATDARSDVDRDPNASVEVDVEVDTDTAAASTSDADGGGDTADSRPLVLVALSGGPDSLALAAATAFEAPRAGMRAGAVVIDHGLQPDSADVAASAASRASALGLDPVMVVRVHVEEDGQGPEAAARVARYEVIEATRLELGAEAVLLGHTLDDQAETVLLGLARGSGGKSLHGMAAATGPILRPLLGIRRADTVQACADQGLDPWHDPHNRDPRYTRTRVRQSVLPLLERELGPGIAEALARTATTLREDSETLDALALEWAREVVSTDADGRISLDVGGIVGQPPALRQRICRIVAEQGFGVSLTRSHTMAVTALATEWRGQGAVDLPGIRVERERDRILFGATDAALDDDLAGVSDAAASGEDAGAPNPGTAASEATAAAEVPASNAPASSAPASDA